VEKQLRQTGRQNGDRGRGQEWREFTGLTGINVGTEDGRDTRLGLDEKAMTAIRRWDSPSCRCFSVTSLDIGESASSRTIYLP
jgi:hypothetical protein